MQFSYACEPAEDKLDKVSQPGLTEIVGALGRVHSNAAPRQHRRQYCKLCKFQLVTLFVQAISPYNHGFVCVVLSVRKPVVSEVQSEPRIMRREHNLLRSQMVSLLERLPWKWASRQPISMEAKLRSLPRRVQSQTMLPDQCLWVLSMRRLHDEICSRHDEHVRLHEGVLWVHDMDVAADRVLMSLLFRAAKSMYVRVFSGSVTWKCGC